MNIQCTRCGAAIPAEDVNLENRLAKCRTCNAVFDFVAQVRDPAGGDGGYAGALLSPRRPVPMPDCLRIVEDIRPDPGSGDYRDSPARRGRLVITRSWYNAQLYFLAFFCIAWDSFLVFWYAMAIRGGGGAFSLIAIIFPIAHVAVGVGLTYGTLAGFLNKTWILVTPESLTIQHRPLPWRGNRTIPASQLKQLYCEQHVTSGKRGSTTTTYTLNAWLDDERKVVLLSDLPDPDQALFLEQQIEDRLGIADAPVAGEFKR